MTWEQHKRLARYYYNRYHYYSIVCGMADPAKVRTTSYRILADNQTALWTKYVYHLNTGFDKKIAEARS